VRKAEDAGAKETREAEKATAAPSLLPRCACLALLLAHADSHHTHSHSNTHMHTGTATGTDTHIKRGGDRPMDGVEGPVQRCPPKDLSIRSPQIQAMLSGSTERETR
jgi:hypothetical protein